MNDLISAKKTINFISLMYKDTMDKLGLVIQGAGFAKDEFIEVIKAPPFFYRYMESECRTSYYGEKMYRPSDFLSFISSCHHGLFNNMTIQDVKEEIPILYSTLILSKDEVRGLESGKALYKKMNEAILNQQILYVDLQDAKDMNLEFLLMSYGKLYFTFEKAKAAHYIRTINIPFQHSKMFNDTISHYRTGRESEIPPVYFHENLENFDKGLTKEEVEALLSEKDSTV